MTRPDPNTLLNAHQLAELLGYENHRSVYELPITQTRHGRRVRWRRADVDAYIKAGRVPVQAKIDLPKRTPPGGGERPWFAA